MRQTLLAIVLVLVCEGCAPTNFVELSAQKTFEPDDLTEPSELVEAGQLALLGRYDRELAAELLKKALEDDKSAPSDRVGAALALAYVGVLDGQPEWVRVAVEAGLPHADPTDSELLLSVLRSYWGSFTARGPVPPDLESAVVAATQRKGDAWSCTRAEASEQVLRASQLKPSQGVSDREVRGAGLITEWLVSAPWGQDPLNDLARQLGPEKRPLAPVEELSFGYRTDARSSWAMKATDGEVYFYDIPETGGVGFAQTYLRFEAGTQDRRVLLTVESNRPAHLYMNGQKVLALHDSDRTEGWTKRAARIVPESGALLTLKLASEDGSGFVRVRALPFAGGDLQVALPTAQNALGGGEQKTATPLGSPVCIEGPSEEDHQGRLAVFPDATGVFRSLLRMEVVNGRPHRYTREARRLLHHLKGVVPDFPGLLAAESRLLANDAALGRSLSRSKRRTVVKRLLGRWPGHVPSLNLLAKLQWSESLTNEALHTWKKALKERPEDRPTLVATLNAYSKKGWRQEALKTARRLEALPLSGPRVLQEVFDCYRRFGQSRDASRVSERLMDLFPLSAVTRRARHLGGLRDEGPVDRAELLLKLWAAKPDRLDVARRAFELYLGAGDLGRARDVLIGLGEVRPDDFWTKKAWLTLSLSGQGKKTTSESMAELKRQAAGQPELERLANWLSGKAGTLGRLKDGKQILASFLAQRKGGAEDPYSAYPIVNLLDSTESMVLEDGTVWSLTHVVRFVQTKSGVDKIGEIRPPRGSTLLELRTIKANGDVLWPERVAGKDDISFSGLVPGDAVEWAWLRRDEVRQDEGGYLTGIAFSQWGIPTRLKRASVTLAPNLNPVLRIRNGAPTPKLRALSDGGTQLFWEDEDLPPMSREPRSAPARVFFPFVDIAVVARGASPKGTVHVTGSSPWERIRRAYSGKVDQLARRGWRTLRRGASFQHHTQGRAQLKAAASWVQREIKGTERFNRFSSTVEQALARRKGNRSLVLMGLARALGHDGTILLCLPEPHGPHSDAEDPIPNANRYWYPVVRTKLGDETVFMDVSDANTPFGDMPASLQGARCFSLDGDESGFVTLPKAKERVRPWRLVLTVDVDEHGGTRLEFHGQGRGTATNALRQVYSRSDKTRHRLIWQQWLTWMVPGSRLVDFEVSGADDPGSDFRFKVRANAAGLFAKRTRGFAADAIVDSLWARHFSTFPSLKELVSLSERDTPVQFERHGEEFQLRLRVSAKHRVQTALKNSTVRTPGGEIRGEQEVSIDGNTLNLTRRFEADGAIVEAEDYPAFRREVLALEEAARGAIRVLPVDP